MDGLTASPFRGCFYFTIKLLQLMEILRIGKLDKMIYCPKCGAKQDGYAGEREPENGDVTICGYCLSVNKFVMVNGEMVLHILSQDELNSIRENEPELWNSLQNSLRLAKIILTEKQITDN